MSNVAPSRRRWETLLWLLPFVLLALPNCGLQTNGCDPGSEDCPFVDDCEEGDPECDNEDTPYCEQHPEDPECEDPDPDEEFEAGTDPSEAIFCDIPKPPIAGLALLCATQAEVDDPDNISLWEAATALVDGDHKSFALDFSNLTACSGLPIKIEYFGEFPDGLRVCINCDEKIPAKYATMEKACIAKCQDEVNQGGVIPDEGAQAFCEANAKLATNHQTDMCYQGACNGGSPELSWVDPRKTPEPVVWIDHIGTDDNGGNDLERTAPTTGGTTADFNAGAASAQLITQGDAWVEFAAADGTATVHVLGVRTSLCDDPVNCPDDEPGISTVGFAIDLNSDGMVYVLEPDATAPDGIAVDGPFGSYTVGERYRVRIKHNVDGTATISYHRLLGGVEQTAFATTTSTPSYPLRVDTTFREQGAKISDVTIVRIK